MQAREGNHTAAGQGPQTDFWRCDRHGVITATFTCDGRPDPVYCADCGSIVELVPVVSEEDERKSWLTLLDERDALREDVTALGAEVDHLRRSVRAVLREWAEYPASYPRSAFADDIRAALDASPEPSRGVRGVLVMSARDTRTRDANFGNLAVQIAHDPSGAARMLRELEAEVERLREAERLLAEVNHMAHFIPPELAGRVDSYFASLDARSSSERL